MSVLLRKQYSSIKKEKLSEQAKLVLKSMYDTTDGFKDVKATRKIKPKFEAFYNKLKESKPEAIVSSKPKSKAAPKKSADDFKAARARRKSQTGVPKDKKAVDKDAIRPAINIKGKRTSKAGNTYYEYRDNRFDKNPSKYPMLEKGGKLNEDDTDEYARKLYKPVGVYSEGEKKVSAFKEGARYAKEIYAKGGYMADDMYSYSDVKMALQNVLGDVNLSNDEVLNELKRVSNDNEYSYIDVKSALVSVFGDANSVNDEILDELIIVTKGGYMAKGGELTEDEQLKLRLELVLDDLKAIKEFIYENGLSEIFQRPTKHSDECWTHFNNIEIACDLNDDESLSWGKFYKEKKAKGGELTEDQQLKLRLELVLDDIRAIKEFIYENGLSETFEKPTKHSDECWTLFNNIEIACDLNDDESLSWGKFYKEKGGYMAKGGEINMNKHIWEGWTVGSFIEELDIEFRYHPKFKSRDEVKKWAMESQPYYKKYIPEVVDYYWEKNQQKYADGGELSKSFTIEEMKKHLDNEFPYSFGFKVFPIKKGSSFEPDYDAEIIKGRTFKGLSDYDLKPKKLMFPLYKRDHEINYEVTQGQENTYFNFLLCDTDGNNYYSGTFGFKDQGDVSSDYITKFIAFLMESYGLPFKVNHSVYAKGGSVKEPIVVRSYFEDEAYEYNKGGTMANGGEMPSSQDLFSLMKIDSKNGHGMLIDGKVYTKKEADLKKDAYEEEMFYGANTEDDMDMQVKIFSVYELLSRKSLPKTTKAKLFSSLQDKQKEIQSLTERFADDKYDWKKDYANGGTMASGGETHRLDSIFEDGGEIAEGNLQMAMSNVKALEHHSKELQNLLNENTPVEAWVVAKLERAETDLSDVTHYIDGLKVDEVESDTYFAKGGSVDYSKQTSDDFELGEIVWDTENKTYGTIIGIYDEYGSDKFEVKLDTDGMQPTENLRKVGSKGDKGKKEQLDNEIAQYERLVKTFPDNDYPKQIDPFSNVENDTKKSSIPNNYEGKTAEEVWSSWTLEQKNLFLEDHTAEIKRVSGNKSWHKSSARTQAFKDLPQYVKDSVIDHVFTGQYARGGSVKTRLLQQQREMRSKPHIVVNNHEMIVLKEFKNYNSARKFVEEYLDENEDKYGTLTIMPKESTYASDYMAKGGYMADGGKVKVYQLGDMWSADFDYNGMLKMGLETNVSWGAEKLNKLSKSFEDVNYHTENAPLYDAVQKLKAGNKAAAEEKLKEFHKLLRTELGIKETASVKKAEAGVGFKDKLKNLLTKAKNATQKGYDKSKEYTKKQIHDQKKRVALSVIDETKFKAKTDAEKNKLKSAKEIVSKTYAQGGRLSRKQKQLDLNKNGKLDSQDFKMLRASKK
jgi:hypothetical protein